jgi:hypothetical protein
MATTTGTLVFYRNWWEIGYETVTGGLNLNAGGNSIKCLLATSTYTPDADNHTLLTDITNEVAGNGYARQTLANQTWVRSTNTVTFNADDVVYTASGGSIVARYFVLFDDTPTSPLDPLICYGLLDQTPLDVTATDGNTLTVQWHATGIFQVTI